MVPAGISSCLTRVTFRRKVSRRWITAEKLDSALEGGSGGKEATMSLQVMKNGGSHKSVSSVEEVAGRCLVMKTGGFRHFMRRRRESNALRSRFSRGFFLLSSCWSRRAVSAWSMKRQSTRRRFVSSMKRSAESMLEGVSFGTEEPVRVDGMVAEFGQNLVM